MSLPTPDTTRDDRDDLGFGRVAAQTRHARFLNKDGTPNSRKFGLGDQRSARALLAGLQVSWPVFFLWFLALLLLTAGVFTLGYSALGPAAIAGSAQLGVDDPFFRAFVLSVGILTTVGAGSLHAVGSTANWLVILESIFGVVLLVSAGGLLVARLARPRVQIRFSSSAVVAPYRGGRAWMFRMINIAPSELTDVSTRVMLAWFEEVDGERVRRFHPLPLDRAQVEFFTLHWTLVHPIDAASPLCGVTPELLRKGEAEFLLLVSGFESTFSTQVHARTSYTWHEVRWDAKFADMFVTTPDDIVTVDAERLDRMDRLPEDTTRVPALGEIEARV